MIRVSPSTCVSRVCASALLSAGLLLLPLAGCKAKTPVPDDAGLTKNVQAQISSDSALSDQMVQVSAQSGVVTLNGTVQNNAEKTLAARDAASVAGVTRVMNNLAVAPAPQVSATVTAPQVVQIPEPPPMPLPAKKLVVKPTPLPAPAAAPQVAERHQPAPIERRQEADEAPVASAPPPPPPPPAQPVFRTMTIPTGSTIPVRVTQTLDSATTQEGSSFSGVVASDILIDGVVAIPAGTTVNGNVDTVHEAAHFKGSSQLSVSLTSISRRGERVNVTTDEYTVQGKGRGVNTAEKAGGGAAVGAILGGIFGGGKGAAIGAAAGGGVGAGSNAITRGQQVQIESETVVRFKLSSPMTLRVRAGGGDHGDHGNGGGLTPRQ